MKALMVALAVSLLCPTVSMAQTRLHSKRKLCKKYGRISHQAEADNVRFGCRIPGWQVRSFAAHYNWCMSIPFNRNGRHLVFKHMKRRQRTIRKCTLSRAGSPAKIKFCQRYARKLRWAEQQNVNHKCRIPGWKLNTIQAHYRWCMSQTGIAVPKRMMHNVVVGVRPCLLHHRTMAYKRKACNKYARNTLSAERLNVKYGCRIPGWGVSTFQGQFNWCMGVKKSYRGLGLYLKRIQRSRLRALRQCRRSRRR